jgi:hypothetical protein
MRSIIVSIIGITFLFPFRSESSTHKLDGEGSVHHPAGGGLKENLGEKLQDLSLSGFRRSSSDSTSLTSPSASPSSDEQTAETLKQKPLESHMDYKKIVIDYLDGKSSIESIPSVGLIIESKIVNVIGEGLMAEFYRLLGDQYSSLGNFSQAAQAYYEALNLPEEPEYHLNKFLSEIGINKRSTPEEIELALKRKA